MFAAWMMVAGPMWVGQNSAQLAEPLKELHQANPDFTRRLLAISQRFVGAPYQFSPLGEGEGVDPDPLFRTDVFDCLSLVEISMALAAEGDIERALQRLNLLRYFAGHVAFGERKHLMESQWIPDNVAAGWLTEITKKVGGELALPVQKTINSKLWAKRKQALDLELPKERVPEGVFAWHAIPLEHVNDVAASIPSGTLLFVVRQDYQSTPYRISHVGIVVQKKGGTFLRHAKDQGVHMVLDMPLADVVKRHQEFVKWPVTGVSLYAPRLAPPPR